MSPREEQPGPASTIGEQEFALLRHIAEAGAITVGEVADSFGVERGLARSTVLTMMERLRKKGYLLRRLAGGIYRYRTRVPAAELLKHAVGRFVDRHLGGSVAPFLAYLSDSERLLEHEVRELEEIVAKLQSRRKGR
jgi:predicted transcriptional regulator